MLELRKQTLDYSTISCFCWFWSRYVLTHKCLHLTLTWSRCNHVTEIDLGTKDVNVSNIWMFALIIYTWPSILVRMSEQVPPCSEYTVKSPNLDVYRLIVQLSSPNPMKLCTKSWMKMYLEQRRQAILQLHLSDRQFYCLLRCNLY